MKDDLLLSAPHLIFSDIFGDSAIVNFLCENSFLDASTSDHSQGTLDVSLSLHSREDTYFLVNPLNISSVISGNAESEYSCF